MPLGHREQPHPSGRHLIHSLVPGVRGVRQSPVGAGQGLSAVRRLRPVPVALRAACERAARGGGPIGQAASMPGGPVSTAV